MTELETAIYPIISLQQVCSHQGQQLEAGVGVGVKMLIKRELPGLLKVRPGKDDTVVAERTKVKSISCYP